MCGSNQRWEGGRIGHGIGDGRWISGDVQRLGEAVTDPVWIAEAPETHLLPHLEAACAADGSPWDITASLMDDGVYIVDLVWSRPLPNPRVLRADAFALIGAVAENATFVRQQTVAGGVHYRVATGMHDDDGPFDGHGHLLLLRITGADIPSPEPA